MTFCAHCGAELVPAVPACARCGAPVAAAADPPPASTVPVPAAPDPSTTAPASRTGRRTNLIVGVVAVLLVGGGAGAYFLLRGQALQGCIVGSWRTTSWVTQVTEDGRTTTQTGGTGTLFVYQPDGVWRWADGEVMGWEPTGSMYYAVVGDSVRYAIEPDLLPGGWDFIDTDVTCEADSLTLNADGGNEALGTITYDTIVLSRE